MHRRCATALGRWVLGKASGRLPHNSDHLMAATSPAGGMRTKTVSRMSLHRSYYVDSRGYKHFDQGSSSPFNMTPAKKVVLGALGLGSAVYYYNSLEEVPYTHRSHAILFVSRDAEKRLGKMVFEAQKQEAAFQGSLMPDNSSAVQLIKRVGTKIAGVASDGKGGGNNEHMQDLAWEFCVIRSNVPNAFVAPGGKVVVFSGLLDLLTTEDELAAVLAHETAHVLARHHAERMSTMNLIAIGKFIFYAMFGFGIPDAAVLMGIFLPYSRRAEHEADVVGLQLMARACYDPVACTTMLSKLNRKEKALEARTGSMPAFLRTHPLTEDRVELVKKELPLAYKLYNESGCGVTRSRFEDLLDGFVVQLAR